MLFKSWTGRSDHAKHFAVLQWQICIGEQLRIISTEKAEGSQTIPMQSARQGNYRKIGDGFATVWGASGRVHAVDTWGKHEYTLQEVGTPLSNLQ
jgi:hypothetical protein